MIDYPLSQRSYSSDWGGLTDSRMNHDGCWAAGAADANQYLEIDAGENVLVSGVATKGRATGADQWVTSYRVEYQVGDSWISVREAAFSGNSDRSTTVEQSFPHPIAAQRWRIVPLTWHGYISMRAALLVSPGIQLDVPEAQRS